MAENEPVFDDVLAAAERFQELVPDAVLVGGTASALYADHRVSFADDHVLAELGERFDEILRTLEESEGWVTQRLRYGRVILGNFDGIETGVLQLRRREPLDVTEIEHGGHRLVVPTDAEMLRVKAWMIVHRNATRDYLDVAALVDRFGLDMAARTLARMDDWYETPEGGADSVTTQLVLQLAEPAPFDLDDVDLRAYRKLAAKWRDWPVVVSACQQLATQLVAERTAPG